MNKTYTVLLSLLWPIALLSQQFPWEGIDLHHFQKKQKKGITERNTEFYVVDSLYCYLFDASTQVDVPTTRQYNLAFTDDIGDVLESIGQQYDPVTGTWENSIHELSEYDAENNLSEQTKQSWDSDNSIWVNDFKTTNTPNQNGDYTDVLNQQWHAPSNDWRNVDRLKFDYNQNGFIQLLEQEIWDTVTMDWQNNFRIVYAVTPNGQVATTLFQLYLNGSYKNISKEVYTFDPDNPQLEVERLTEVWDNITSAFLKSSRILKEYDSNENLTTETHQLWNAPDSTWLNNNRFLRNYNANGDVTIKTDLTWNGAQWANFFQTKNTHDPDFNLARFEVSQWLQEWLPLNSCDFYWRFHHETVAVKEAHLLDCEMSNPYHIGTPIHCPNLLDEGPAQLSIFDLSGKLVYSKMVDNQNFINIAQPIPSGFYVLNISNEKGLNFSKKIVIVD